MKTALSLLLIFIAHVGFCEDVPVKTNRYSEVVEFVVFMSGNKINEPTLIGLDEKKTSWF